MKKINFSEGWTYKKLNSNENEKMITIPHDAMFHEKRTKESIGGKNIGWFEAYDYEYKKTFYVPSDAKGKHLIVEFEGVYHHAEVYVNGKKIAFRPYGYTNFYVDITNELQWDTENEMIVIARNKEQPNSRWYSGAGIYRPVHLYIGEEKYIRMNGVKIRTVDINPIVIEVEVATKGQGELNVVINQGESCLTSKVLETTSELTVLRLQVDGAKLWSPEIPELCECLVTFEGEQVSENFGIRTLTWDASGGLKINNKRVILRGACIHHDNGVLGACAYDEAEERKVRLLKENGYNAIRSAHNPCSKAMLAACDRLGMLMMDEYLDVWYIHKTQYDYATYMGEWWQKDLEDMVNKDYNHPSVIMYSTGNEVAETAQERGIQLTKEMTQYLHGLDPTRPVTCGINIFFNYLSSLGFGVYSDKKAENEVKENVKKSKGTIKKKAVGSEFYNNLAGLLGAHTMKVGATLHGCDVKTRDAYANMDIAGYNYGILRYKKDLKKYPRRLILGTETFCIDAYKFWEIAKKNNRIIGDFVWAGMDYMGEAGIGGWEYEEYVPQDALEEGWLTAGSGRLNILGVPSAESLYTKVAFEEIEGPIIAARPIFASTKHTPSAWKMTDAMESWSFTGCSGKPVEVEVYARAHTIELFINGKMVGRKKLRKSCRVVFKTAYQEGEVMAITRDASGKELGRKCLYTAGKETQLTLRPEQSQVKANGLSFIHIQYTDKEGVHKPLERGVVTVKVEGGELLGLGNGCSYNTNGYLKASTPTYYGAAMAVIRAYESEYVKITVSDGRNEKNIQLERIQ